jgi:5'-nucleotidase / UDP-sugar diphosphatase
MTRLRRLFLIVVLLGACGISWHYVADASPPAHLTILHINDFHGHLMPFIEKAIQEEPVGGASFLAAMIREARDHDPEGTLLLSAGDMFQGSPISNLFNGKPVLEMMNELKFDAMALGNHEFDWGLDVLNSLRSGASFPFLSANIVDADGKYLLGVIPYTLFKKKGLQIAVIGLTTTETPFTTKPDNVNGLNFTEPAKILPGVIDQVRAKGARFIIVLSHLGLEEDRKLARQVSGIHVIVGGHSHTAIPDPVVEGGTLIVQAGYYGIYLGILNLDIDPETGKVIHYTQKGVLRSVKPTSNKVSEMALVAKYDRKIRAEFNRVVGHAAVDLIRSDFSESNIGNMICDAIQASTRADVAFTNGGAIRADIPAGDITMEQVYTVMPFDNVVITMDLTGKQIIDILEESASGRHRIMQISGLMVRYDGAHPVGSRVISVAVGGKPIVREQIYRVVTNDFLAAGGDQYTTFLKGTRLVYGETLRDAILAYLKQHSPVHPRIEGRNAGKSQ